MAQKEAIGDVPRSLPNALKTGSPTRIRTWNLLINSPLCVFIVGVTPMPMPGQQPGHILSCPPLRLCGEPNSLIRTVNSYLPFTFCILHCPMV